MLCRAILTAIAISCTFSREIPVQARGQGSPRLVQIKDVICVLLLSGLQKEDLDVNTLQKLRRHNVNIYDMNNESLRQECLLKSFSETGKGTQDYKSTEENISVMPITEQGEESNVANIQKKDTATLENIFGEQSKLRNLFDEIKIKGIIQREQNRYDDIKTSNRQAIAAEAKVEETQDQTIEYFNHQPSLESMLKFWSQLSPTAGAVTETSTTDSQPHIDDKDTATSNVATSESINYLHSRDMEYINKVLAGYLASKSVPTTTQAIRNVDNIDTISKKIKELLAKKARIEKIYSIAPSKNVEDTISKKITLKDIDKFAKVFQISKIDEVTKESAQQLPQNVINYNDNQQSEMLQRIPSNPVTNLNYMSENPKLTQKQKTLQYVDDLLGLNLKVPTSYDTKSIQDTIKNNEDQKRFKKVNKSLQYSGEDTNNSNKGLIQVLPRSRTLNNQAKDGPSDMIQAIAEKVKDIVMKDIRKEISTTDASTLSVTTPSTTTTTASSTTITSTTEVPTTQQKEMKESNQVIQTLMELLKDFKTMKDSTTVTTVEPSKVTMKGEKTNFRNPPLIPMYRTAMDESNLFGINVPLATNKQLETNIHNQNMKQIPLVPVKRELQVIPYLPQTIIHHKNQYRSNPITIQTNSAEIPPLAIQVSKPLKFMNQLIIVTTQNPFEKLKEEQLQRENKQRINDKYVEIINAGGQNPTYADFSKKIRIEENAKNVYRDSHKDEIQKLIDRIKNKKDNSRELGRRGPDHGSRLIHTEGTNHQETLSLPLESNHKILNRPLNSNYHSRLNRPVERNYHDTLNHPDDQSDRDIITREVLSRLVDSNRHDVISRLVEPNPQTVKNSPVDLNHQSRSHHSDAFERIEHERSHPRYKKKYHEELERLENRGRNNYNTWRETTEGCGEIPSRQQMPLTKIKERPKFDDTHFRNFLKSQQKVTDMLERILAEKTKTEPRSVEIV